MKRTRLAMIPMLALLGVGATGLLTVPIACGCESGPDELEAAAGLALYPAKPYVAAQYEEGLNTHAAGSTRARLELFAPGLGWCRQSSSTQADCFVTASSSWLIARGFRIRFETTPTGEIRHARVQSDWQFSAGR